MSKHIETKTMKELEDKIHRILEGIDLDQCEDDTAWWETSTGAKFGADKLKELQEFVSKEIKDIATSFAEWIKKEGYIYAGEHDYMYPDANGLIGGGYLFDEFIKERYKQ